MKTTEQLLLDLFKELSRRPDSKPTTSSILILSTPRCGSTLYCDVLSDLNVIGECKEWFNMRYITAYAQLKGSENIDFSEYINFIKLKTSNNTGVFAVNMHIEQYISLMDKKVDLMQIGFDCVVYLSRVNKISQAISLTKAQITDSWSSKTKAKQALPDKTPFTKITNALLQLVHSHEYYLEHLKSLTHFEYCYEDFKKLDNPEFFTQPLKKLNLSIVEPVNLQTRKKIQSDQTSAIWSVEYTKLIGL